METTATQLEERTFPLQQIQYICSLYSVPIQPYYNFFHSSSTSFQSNHVYTQ